MAFLKSLINWILPDNVSSELEEPRDHYQALEYLRKHHEWIDVIHSKTESSYQSLILEIDLDNKELIIDELYPPQEQHNLQAGDTLEIISRSKRVPISFYTRLLLEEQRDGEIAYHLELPEEVGSNHSRGAFRVYVENEVGLDIELYLDNEPLSAVKIINLSADGIKLSFPQEMEKQLERQRSFSNCLIRMPTGYDIDCDIELCNLYAIRNPQPHSLAGGKLTVNQPQHRAKLQQYIASVQRRQRRMENRDL